MRIRIPLLKRLDTYIIGKFLGTYFFSILLIISIVVVFDYNEHIDRLTQNNAPWQEIVFDYYLNFVPYYANMFSALFVFISVIFFTSKLADNSEIIAMISAGVSFRRLMRPYLISATLIAILTFFLGSEIIPRGSVSRLAFENQYMRKKKNATYADNVQMQVDTGVIAFIEHFDGPSKTGYHFSLDKFENKKLVSHLTATSITYDSLANERFHWHLNNVTIRDLKGMREYISHKQSIDSLIIMEPQDFLFTRNLQETMTNSELLDYIDRQRIRGTGNVKAFLVEYYKRFASCIAAFVMTIIGASLSSRKRKGGMGFALGIGLVLSVAYAFLQGIAAGFATNANVPPLLAVWLPNILYIIIAIYLYKKAPR
ncbi:MAG: YjgP/YjgQ family permease [Bacteroidaceae bacterium]|nr:YjgP/YjgQ family permease [Bacteroidaceae bacterium]